MLAKIRTFLENILTEYFIAKYIRLITLLETARSTKLRKLSTAMF